MFPFSMLTAVCVAIAGCGGESTTTTPDAIAGPGPTPTPSPTPTPAPAPPGITYPALNSAMPAGPVSISIDGKAMSSQEIDVVSTATGNWPVRYLGAVEGGKAYEFRLESRPDWWSVCIARYGNDTDSSVGERFYTVTANGHSMRFSVLGGSLRCADNGEPIGASADRLAQAVQYGRTIPYSPNAFSGWPSAPDYTVEEATLSKYGYRLDRIYGRNSGVSAIGVVSAQGGEYASSRGFVSGVDAAMVAAALYGKSAMFTEAAKRARIDTLYGLTLPNFAIWSENHHTLRDPQMPFSGDRPYVNEGQGWGNSQKFGEGNWVAPSDYPYLSELGAQAGVSYSHDRDEPHLFNHGYSYWLATGDPRAALIQQAIAAYAMASVYQGPDGTNYRTRFNYQRATINMFSAMWKLRDISQNLTTQNGQIFWSRARIDKMVSDVLTSYSTQLAAMDRSTDTKDEMASAFLAIDRNPAFSDFMNQSYGPEAAYLFASVGKGDLLRRMAQNMVVRTYLVGGTLGMEDPDTSTLISIDGSAITLPQVLQKFATRPLPNTNFDQSAVHTVQRAYWMLKFAQDAARRGWIAPIDNLDQAIARMESDRSATTNWRYSNILEWKHAGVPFGS